MALVRAPALVLQAFPYSETSKILRLLTPTHGVRSVIAKGAMRPKSRFGGVLEPFTEGVAMLYVRDGRDLHTLSGWDLVRARQVLGRTLLGFAAASLLAEIVLRAGTEEPDSSLFEHVVAAMNLLADAAPVTAGAALTAVWMGVSLIGLAPQTESCVSCGRGFDVDEVTRFDVEGGGAACVACRVDGRLLDPRSRAELGARVTGEVVTDVHDGSVQRALLRGYLNAQLARDRPLRSMELMLRELAEAA